MSTQIRPVLMAILSALTALNLLPASVDIFLHENVDGVIATIVLIWAAIAAFRNKQTKELKAEVETKADGGT